MKLPHSVIVVILAGCQSAGVFPSSGGPAHPISSSLKVMTDADRAARQTRVEEACGNRRIAGDAATRDMCLRYYARYPNLEPPYVPVDPSSPPSPPDSRVSPVRVIEPASNGLAEATEVALIRQGGVLGVPITINGEIKLTALVDSGAADVSVPADVVLTSIRTGSITASDFTGEKVYVIADGTRVPSATFRIKSLTVGNITLRDVGASVASVQGPLLLGQSFLNRFTSWSIDNRRQVLVLSR